MRIPPKSTVCCDGVQDCQELSHARHQSHLPGLARGEQPLVEPLDAGVVMRANQRGGGGTLETTGVFEDYRGKAQIFELREELAAHSHRPERSRNLSPGGQPRPDCGRGFSNSGPCNRSGSVGSVDVSRDYDGDDRSQSASPAFVLGDLRGSPGSIKLLEVIPLGEREEGGSRCPPTFPY